jgi:hypothetical protein
VDGLLFAAGRYVKVEREHSAHRNHQFVCPLEDALVFVEHEGQLFKGVPEVRVYAADDNLLGVGPLAESDVVENDGILNI